jgi:hypothetical protein
MHHLRQRVDPRIGTSGGMDPDRFRANPAKRVFQHRLNRPPAALPLPAGEGAAVVFDAESDPHTDSDCRWGKF